MTREEALEILDKKLKKMMTDYQEYLEHIGEPLKEHEKWLHALNMAIEALQERPKGRWDKQWHPRINIKGVFCMRIYMRCVHFQLLPTLRC